MKRGGFVPLIKPKKGAAQAAPFFLIRQADTLGHRIGCAALQRKSPARLAKVSGATCTCAG
jgi:hypothetical protein